MPLPHYHKVTTFLLMLAERFEQRAKETSKEQYWQLTRQLTQILEILEKWSLGFSQLEATVDTLAARLAAVLEKVNALKQQQGQVPPEVEAQVTALEQAVGITQPPVITPPANQ